MKQNPRYRHRNGCQFEEYIMSYLTVEKTENDRNKEALKFKK